MALGQDRAVARASQGELTGQERAVFWYGCNMARHGEIVRLAAHMLEALGMEAAPAGGPGHCCGSPKEANARINEGMARRTVEKFNATGHGQVVTWCPSCHMNMQDFMAPVTPTAFGTVHISEVLHARRDRLRPLLAVPVRSRVLLHAHHGFDGRVPVNTLVPDLLRLVTGLEVVEHPLRAPGHMCSGLAGVPGALADAHRAALAAMAETGADTLCTIFHSCHREAVALERGRPIRVANWIHLLAEAMGLPFEDEYKAWRNAPDPREAVGAARVESAGEVAFARLVEPELRRPPPV
jgi:Fe-S oxidoreductase